MMNVNDLRMGMVIELRTVDGYVEGTIVDFDDKNGEPIVLVNVPGAPTGGTWGYMSDVVRIVRK